MIAQTDGRAAGPRIGSAIALAVAMLAVGSRLQAAEGDRLFVQCSVRDAESAIVFQAPVFEVDAAHYDADRQAWRRTAYSQALVAYLNGRGLSLKAPFDGCFADLRRTEISLDELREPFRGGDDRGYENVRVFTEQGEPGEFDDTIGTMPTRQEVYWAPDAATRAEAALRRQQKDKDTASLEYRLSGYIFCRYDVTRGGKARNFFSGVMPKPVRLKHPSAFWSRENDVAYPPYGAVYNFFEAHLQAEDIVTDDWTVTPEQWGSNNMARPAQKYCRSASNRTETQDLLDDMSALQKRKGVEVVMTDWTWQSQDADSILEQPEQVKEDPSEW